VAAKKFETIDEYIALFPENVQRILRKLRETIRQVAPEVAESISYDMPTFKIRGERLVYFSGWKSHIGFCSIPEGNEALQKRTHPLRRRERLPTIPTGQTHPI
jgi:uncharacterized protein YdhG (YjbR/CyaY superfamily)